MLLLRMLLPGLLREVRLRLVHPSHLTLFPCCMLQQLKLWPGPLCSSPFLASLSTCALPYLLAAAARGEHIIIIINNNNNNTSSTAAAAAATDLCDIGYSCMGLCMLTISVADFACVCNYARLSVIMYVSVHFPGTCSNKYDATRCRI